MTENTLTIHTPESMVSQPNTLAFLTDSNSFEHIWRVATAFSGSKLVPTHFQNKPQDTFVAIQMALQLQINPLLCLQNTQVINGRPSFSAQFMIGLANTRGPFVGPLTWHSEGKGDSLEVTCQATLRATGEVVSVMVSMAMAKAEGWTKNAKYRSIPEQMLRYRSATWLIRLYCPEVTCGMQSDDEVSTMPRQSQTFDSRNEILQPTNSIEVKSDPVADLNQRLTNGTGNQPSDIDVVPENQNDIPHIPEPSAVAEPSEVPVIAADAPPMF